MRLVVPMRGIPSLNRAYSGSWVVRKRAAEQAHALVHAAVLEQLGVGCAGIAGPVRITVTAYAPRPRDPDNLPKFLLDGLVAAGAIEDDSAAIVRELVLRSRRGSPARFEIDIEPLDPEDRPLSAGGGGR